jgi:hypothetical protein
MDIVSAFLLHRFSYCVCEKFYDTIQMRATKNGPYLHYSIATKTSIGKYGHLAGRYFFNQKGNILDFH